MKMPMVDFLVSLGDPKNYAEFTNDPSSYMSRFELLDEQKSAIKKKIKYAIRRFASDEMKHISLHARIMHEIYTEGDPNFRLMEFIERGLDNSVDMDYDDYTDTTFNNNDQGPQLTDLEDFLPSKLAEMRYFPHLFDGQARPSTDKELVFLGTGIRGASQITPEAEYHIRSADKVFYCVGDLVIERKIMNLNSTSEDLYPLYGDEKPRRETYEEMVSVCYGALKVNRKVAVIFYGHPGIFVYASHKAIRMARAEGIKAYMAPGISSLDCLFADIGIDPSRFGCQIFEATDLLVKRRKPGIDTAVIIMQVGCVGDTGFRFKGYERRNMPILQEYLSEIYGDNYEVILYEAASYPECEPRIRLIPLFNLVESSPTGITTMYIPPKIQAAVDPEMISRLGLPAR
ncbi:SAM-dependent methyltransferase [Methylobacterium sp. Leaf86]|uniref:SAM-dependent methyltransferase n=1 Tax=Methylobacterium sp. Leaf86 TaxID=1736242 RepID=UPI0009E7F90E|nr:SAM-dependent methyltransferase [Methylobacterium sp. Leaf86]